MAVTKVFTTSIDDTTHNTLATMLSNLGVITDEQRADMLKGTLIYKPGIYSMSWTCSGGDE